MKARKILVIASLCLCLFVFGPHYQSIDTISVSPKQVMGQTAGDDTPSADDISDFASEYDQDGDGEVDEPDEEDEDDGADLDGPDEADEDDDYDEADDSDEVGDADEYDDDADGEETENDEEEDMAHSGKNRDDIDGDASPEFRLSGYDRYRTEGTLRRLGARAELTPLISREELRIFDTE